MDSYTQVGVYEAWKKILAEKPDPTALIEEIKTVSYTHLTLPTTTFGCRSRWWAGH